jgi:hypothetical protein
MVEGHPESPIYLSVVDAEPIDFRSRGIMIVFRWMTMQCVAMR